MVDEIVLGQRGFEHHPVGHAHAQARVKIAFDRRVMQELISLAPPGLDELMALMKLMDLVQEGRYAAYVLDLAPNSSPGNRT